MPQRSAIDRTMHAPHDVSRWGDECARRGRSLHPTFIISSYRVQLMRSHLFGAGHRTGKTRRCEGRCSSSLSRQSGECRSSIGMRHPISHKLTSIMTGCTIVGFSQHSESSPWYILSGKLKRLITAFSSFNREIWNAIVATGDCAVQYQHHRIPIDYIFTDPPFGENIYYADLNFLVEAWHRVFTQTLSPKRSSMSAKRKGYMNIKR